MQTHSVEILKHTFFFYFFCRFHPSFPQLLKMFRVGVPLHMGLVRLLGLQGATVEERYAFWLLRGKYFLAISLLNC